MGTAIGAKHARFIQDRLDRNNISQEEFDKFLKEIIESYHKRLAEILTK